MEEFLSDKGDCPYCSSNNLHHGSFELDHEGGFFPVDCLDCKKDFRETHTLEFAGNWGEPKEEKETNV